MYRRYHYTEWICDRCGKMEKEEKDDFPNDWEIYEPVVITKNKTRRYVLCPVCARILDKMIHAEMKYYEEEE